MPGKAIYDKWCDPREKAVEALREHLQEEFGVQAPAYDLTLDRNVPFMECGRDVKLDVLRFRFQAAVQDEAGHGVPSMTLQNALASRLAKVWKAGKRPLVDVDMPLHSEPASGDRPFNL